MILFSFDPKPMMMETLSPILQYSKPYFDGIMDDGYRYQLDRGDHNKPLRIYLVGQTKARADGTEYYIDPIAVVAFNETDACTHYYEWRGQYGSIITMLAENAGKAQVAPPR